MPGGTTLEKTKKTQVPPEPVVMGKADGRSQNRRVSWDCRLVLARYRFKTLEPDVFENSEFFEI